MYAEKEGRSIYKIDASPLQLGHILKELNVKGGTRYHSGASFMIIY